MRNWNWATKFILCSSAVALAACGSSADSTTSTVGGAANIGGYAAAGGRGTGGAAGDTGGAIATAGSESGTGGAIATTGGSNAAGGTSAASATGGLSATGGAAASTTAAETMCDGVCTLLLARVPPLDCATTDRAVCVATCNSTYTKLAAANATCSNAYVALYQCGLSQPASGWSCVAPTSTINIPIPPTDADTCGAEYNSLFSILLTTPRCVQALNQ